ncbi:prominin-2-like, partial [Mustelus asterias]
MCRWVKRWMNLDLVPFAGSSSSGKLRRNSWKMQREVLPLCLALVLTSLLPGHAASPNCTADHLEFQSVFESGFSQLSGDAGSLEPLYDMVNRYLDAVQPNPFPTDIVEQLLKERSVEPLKVVKYEAGYLVSLIIGALFFIFMPLVGLFFCCCRCCNKCGGQVKERTDSTDCRRNTLALFLLMTTIIILAGVACAFTANQKVTDAMEPSLAAIKDTLVNATSYVDNIVKAISKIAKQFSVPKEQTLTELGRIGRTLGSTIQDTLAPIITPVLVMLMNRIQEFGRIKNHLLTINSSQISLQESQRQLKDNLTRIQGEIDTTLRLCGADCEPFRSVVKNLELNINYTQPPEFQALLAKFTSISEDKLNNSLQK